MIGREQATHRATGVGSAKRYDEVVAPIMAPFVTAMLEAAALRPGEAVLDLACGTGFAARAAAAKARPDGVAVVGARVAELLAARTAADGSASLPFASLLVSGTRTG